MTDIEFTGITFIVLATDETDSLVKTIDNVFDCCRVSEIEEIMIVYPDFVTQECLSIARMLCDKYSIVSFTLHQQTRRGLGAGVKEVIPLVRSSHMMILDSDWSHDFTVIKEMMEKVRTSPERICKISRKLKKNSFHNYSKIQYLFNQMAQFLLRVMYGNACTDMTDAGQILPTVVCKAIKWDSDSFPFLIELVLRPLRLGLPVTEIPCDCFGRKQGISGNSAQQKLGYLEQAIKIRFTPKKRIAPGLFLQGD